MLSEGSLCPPNMGVFDIEQGVARPQRGVCSASSKGCLGRQSDPVRSQGAAHIEAMNGNTN